MKIKILFVILLLAASGFSDEVLTEDERIIALTLLGEARGEGKKGLFAVACVIQRRAWDRELTPAKVCHQKRQFGIWNGSDSKGNYKRKKERDLWYLWDSKEKMYARHLAKCLNNKKVMLMDITEGANHYLAEGENPSWIKGRKPTIIIGQHRFYRINK